ncbi:MAG: SDR family NAD(P)-dependent oxidoreductase, partial [Gemmatimonadota bacterium]
MSTLDGRVAIVTGAARGIGAETARVLAGAGATVFVTDILDDEGRATADALPGGRGHYLSLDVTDEGAWQDVIDAVEAEAGRLDVLVNNAGIEMMKPIEELALDEWRLVCRINLDGVFLGTRAAVGLMKKEKDGGRGGSIVNISSVAGLVGTPFQT